MGLPTEAYHNSTGALVILPVGVFLVSEVFPERMQTLAGAICNTVDRFGRAIGLALVGDLSDLVMHKSKYAKIKSPDALLMGIGPIPGRASDG